LPATIIITTIAATIPAIIFFKRLPKYFRYVYNITIHQYSCVRERLA
jgi:hypothetical protein